MATSKSEMSTVDSAVSDVNGAINMGRDVAKTAKTVSKAAGQVTTGNYVGAAMTLLKDPETMKRIIAISLISVLIFSLITLLFLYALPSMIFEASVSYFNEVGERWKAEAYTGGGSVFWQGVWATIKTGGSIAGDVATTIWNGVKSLFTSADGSEDYGSSEDTLTADGLELKLVEDGNYYSFDSGEVEMVVDKGSAEYKTLENKIKAAIKKVDARQTNIKSAVSARSGAIQNAVSNRYAEDYDYFSTTVNITCTPMQEAAAIQLLSLYTVQTGGSLIDLKLSDFMKWMGWNGTNLGTSTISLADLGVSASVKTWKGEFLPQYLYEQKKQEERYAEQDTSFVMPDYSGNMCPAVDMLIAVNCPNLDSIPIEVSTTIESVYDHDEEVDDGEGNITTTEVYVDVEKTHGHAIVNINIYPRSVTALAQLAGLWDGALYEDQSTKGQYSLDSYFTGYGDGAELDAYVAEILQGDTFAAWLRGHINGSGTLDATARQMIFGDSGASQFVSDSVQRQYMTSVTVPIWSVDSSGNKYSTTASIGVHYLVKNDVIGIFQEIYNDPEQFPLYKPSNGGANVGGYRTASSGGGRHNWGMAIDMNVNWNPECNFLSGSFRTTCGVGWWPEGYSDSTIWVGFPMGRYHGGLTAPSQYSFGPHCSVVRAFANHGWGWGGNGWFSGAAGSDYSAKKNFDFMHFSVLPSGG